MMWSVIVAVIVYNYVITIQEYDTVRTKLSVV